MQEVIVVGMGICHTWECGGTIHLGTHCSYEDLVTRRRGLWACEDGNVVLVAACLGGVHIGGAASGVSSPQASEVGVPCCQGTQVLGGLITFKIWTHLSLYFCAVSVRVWGLLKVGLCTDSSPRKRRVLAGHLLNARTV